MQNGKQLRQHLVPNSNTHGQDMGVFVCVACLEARVLWKGEADDDDKRGPTMW